MNGKDPGCRVILRHCLAIILRKEGCQGDPGDFWMYESGYLLFQGLISANSVCWWNAPLQSATRCLAYRGYVSPGALLVSAELCSLEVIRGAWAKRILQPPVGYQIIGIEDIEECFVNSIVQTQWTPLPEAVCAVVLRLSSQGRPAAIESIRESLILAFPHVLPPTEQALYDTLVQLTTERKLYHTSKGYFIVTPERRRSRSHSRGRHKYDDGANIKGMLLSTEEALVLVHGEMTTIRDGDVTHQCIQTNLADVICGGNSSDKILYARNNKRRSASFPSRRSPDRRGSFKLWGSSRRLCRSVSTRTLAKHCTDSSSSTEYPNSSDSVNGSKKRSLLSRLFRKQKHPQCQINSFSAQFPPMEWFNSKAIHLHSVGTQTCTVEKESALSIPYYLENPEAGFTRSATLPRQHRRQLSNDSTYVTSYAESLEHSSSLRHSSPLHASHTSSTLPHNSSNIRSQVHSTRSSKRTSHSSLSPKICISDNDNENHISGKPTPSREPKRAPNPPASSTIKTPSLESLKTGYLNSIYQDKSYQSPEQSALTKNEISSESNGAMNKSPAGFKNSDALDNSGPSSIESHKSNKTGSSSAASGPSSLESYRTVINRSPYSSNLYTINSQNGDVEVKPVKRTVVKKKEAKHKPSIKPKVNDTSPKSKLPHNNSFTLQVTTNQGGSVCSNNSNNAVTATINGGNTTNTKIYVQNSPVRSVITFENGKDVDTNPNVVIINRAEPLVEQNNLQNLTSGSKKVEDQEQKYLKNTNSVQVKEGSILNNSPILTEHANGINNEAMNNAKYSYQTPSKEGFNYRNILKTNTPYLQNQSSFNSCPDSPGIQSCGSFTRNSLSSSPSSPTKISYSNRGSLGNVFGKLSDSKSSLDKYCNTADSDCSPIHLIEKNYLGSQSSINYKDQDGKDKSLDKSSEKFPSLSDLSFNFTSLAAQKILKGISINSIDTLVELNASVEKQNNCDVVHTDFGMV